MKLPTIITLIAVVFLIGCTSTVEETAQNYGIVAQGDRVSEGVLYHVVIESGKFMPATLSIQAGDTVQWINNDYREAWEVDDKDIRRNLDSEQRGEDHPAFHSVKFYDLLVDELLIQGGSYSYTFTESGVFGYIDQYEPTNQGTIVVS